MTAPTLLLTLLLALLVPQPSPAPLGTWPLQPEPTVVRRFDPPDLPYGAGHRGVDLAGHPGQAVRSALPGRVTFAGRIAGRGVVVVGHGPTRTTYEPVTPAVPVGTDLAEGAVLGRLEATGSHCPPRACLHWGWIAGRTYLDPLRLVGAGPVRLLPLDGRRPHASAPAGSEVGRGLGLSGGLSNAGAQAHSPGRARSNAPIGSLARFGADAFTGGGPAR